MANNSAPTHLFAGSVGIVPNTYPTPGDATFGGFRQLAAISTTDYAADTTVTIADTDPRVFVYGGDVTTVNTLTVSYPAPSAALNGSSFLLYVAETFTAGDLDVALASGTSFTIGTVTGIAAKSLVEVRYIQTATSPATYAAIITRIV